MEVIRWVKDSYERIAERYGETRRGGPIANQLIPIINRYIQGEPGIVVDIGPGNGDNLRITWERFHQSTYIGCELSINMIRGSQVTIHWVNCSATHIPIRDGVADLVIAIAVLHHVPKSIIKYVLEDINRIMKNNGIFIATVWACNESTLRKLIPFNDCEGSIPWSYGVEEQVHRYYRLYRQGELESELGGAGFVPIESGALRLGRYLNYYAVALKGQVNRQ
ncbi:class I SAM-dependent methyltransferase [Vulcanisaeta thermophila]|uniref:class I SAM-dependent methyltransferase n=1 Tax=Vulcanisaeta thermophila TaxID=867917 RepID=UPI0008531455|nr:class I SAM-dependent methyltransferase [Vulcanisaeta thermophila]